MLSRPLHVQNCTQSIEDLVETQRVASHLTFDLMRLAISIDSLGAVIYAINCTPKVAPQIYAMKGPFSVRVPFPPARPPPCPRAPSQPGLHCPTSATPPCRVSPQLVVFAFRDYVKEFCSSEAHDRIDIDTSKLTSSLDKLEAACPALARKTQAGRALRGDTRAA